MKVTLGIKDNTEIRVLPVVSEDAVKINYGASLNENKDSVKHGQFKVLGLNGLASVTCTGFFTDNDYRFIEADAKEGVADNIEWYTKLKEDRIPVQLVITRKDVPIFSKLMALETFEISTIDRAGDATYSVAFEEYKEVK